MPWRAAEASSNVFDEQQFLERMMGNRQLAGAVIGEFVADVPSQLRALGQHLAAHDAARARLGAHALKGAAAAVAAEDLRAIAAAIESEVKAGELRHSAQLFPEAVAAFERFKNAATPWIALSGAEDG